MATGKSTSKSILQVLTNRILAAFITILVIIFLTMLGLEMADRGQARLPLEPLPVLSDAFQRTLDYFIDHPSTYTFQKREISAFQFISNVFTKSAGLLLASLAIAILVGIPLGLYIALGRKGKRATLGVALSVLGISVPSFLLAMLLHVANIQLSRLFGWKALPAVGFGWDLHVVIPALVLAARPLTQIAQVTYVTLDEIFRQDYITLARAKGVGPFLIRYRHAFRNALIPILTTVGASLRFSLASLPVVEFFFNWPGIGLTFLTAISSDLDAQVADLTVSLGLLFLLINLALEVIYPLLDPRVGIRPEGEEQEDRQSLWEQGGDTLSSIRVSLKRLWNLVTRREAREVNLEAAPGVFIEQPIGNEIGKLQTNGITRIFRHWLTNPAMVIGTLLAAFFFFLVFFGNQLTQVSAYKVHGVMIVDGIIGAAPFSPSSVFPWGTDHIGRDVQAMVFTGARQTLSLAFFAMLARLLLGTVLGILAGGRPGGWLDRIIMGTVGVWAAFPATIFAMILILGLGIQKGMWVFIFALGIIGWGEVAQIVRTRVLELKPKAFIEAARSIGSRPIQILMQHFLPNLTNALILLGVLEMGGVIMILSELGMLNIYLGGGSLTEWSAFGKVVAFSDVPEWGAMLANVREWWRSYPWLAFYPGLAFFLAILTFNLWGEGLRRFMDESRVNIRRFNRVILSSVLISAVGLGFMVRSAAPLSLYAPDVQLFDEQGARDIVAHLSRPEYQGRAAGTPGGIAAAEWIGRYMESIGLQPAGYHESFLQNTPCNYRWTVEAPTLEVLDNDGSVVSDLRYRKDFSDLGGGEHAYGYGIGNLVGLIANPEDLSPAQGVHVIEDLKHRIVLMPYELYAYTDMKGVAGALVYVQDEALVNRHYLQPIFQVTVYVPYYYDYPVLTITRSLAEQLVQTTGTSLEEIESRANRMRSGEYALTADGVITEMNAFPQELPGGNQPCYNVVGYIPGTNALGTLSGGRALDNLVIMVAASYDGLGTDANGTIYPGANDNASAVATMLEVARAIKSSPNKPEKTIVFVARSGGERAKALLSKEIMNSLPGFNTLTIETVLELDRLGYGEGDDLVLGAGSSYRLVSLFNRAARRVGASTRARDTGAQYHFSSTNDIMGRTGMSLYMSWQDSQRYAHTPEDTVDHVTLDHLRKAGETLMLAVQVMSHEEEY